MSTGAALAYLAKFGYVEEWWSANWPIWVCRKRSAANWSDWGLSRHGPCPPGQGHSSQLAGPIRHLIYKTVTWEAVGKLI